MTRAKPTRSPRRAFVLATLLAAAMPACGKTKDVLNERGGDGAANGRDGGEDSGTESKAPGTGGASGATASGGAAPGGSTSGRGNGDGSGGTAAGGAATGDAGPTGSGGVNPLDPHAAERKELVSELCDTLDQYPCIFYQAQRSVHVFDKTNQVAICNEDTQVVAYTIFQAGCFEQWAAEMRCLIARPVTCPCDGNDCIFKLPAELPSPCPTESQALLDCMGRQPPSSADVSGSTGTCSWYKETNGTCGATCSRDRQRIFSANCDGTPDGPQACYCELNGVPLHDGTPDLLNYGSSFYGDDCVDVAQKMADGQCEKITSCCFTWFPGGNAGMPQQCSCVSDPSLLGSPTCSGVAALGGGQVVDLCPQYEYASTTGGFPIPRSNQ